MRRVGEIEREIDELEAQPATEERNARIAALVDEVLLARCEQNAIASARSGENFVFIENWLEAGWGIMGQYNGKDIHDNEFSLADAIRVFREQAELMDIRTVKCATWILDPDKVRETDIKNDRYLRQSAYEDRMMAKSYLR